ncbi:hypothetical protein [Saccharothrix lopnurensis]|uniref:Uncharacterized protein n=1 Tax=Saccharothrix lopnurensis TaxID=1670621 RepID=A0ABW1PHS7_9PSEU
MTATPIFDELASRYLSEEAATGGRAPRPPRTPDEDEPQWPGVGVLEQWWSQCARTVG